MEEIVAAFEAGYRLAPVSKNSKAGLGRWNIREYGLGEILAHVNRGGNVAIKMGETRENIRVCVVDRDSRDMESFRFLQKHRLRSPFEVETASGNWHVYGRVPDEVTELRTKIKALGLPIDLKMTGICLFAGSVIDGEPYVMRKGKRVVNPAELPVFDLAAILEEYKPARKTPIVTPEIRDCNPSERRDIKNTRAYLRAIPSVMGENGSRGLMRCCYILAERFVWNEAMIELLIWNEEVPRPAWDVKELNRALTNAFTRKGKPCL